MMGHGLICNKRLFRTLGTAWFSLCLVSALAAQAAPRVLTLADALQRSSEANLQFLLAQEQVSQTRAQADNARSALLPSVSLNASQSHSQQYINFGDEFRGTFASDGFSGALQARLSVFDYNAWAAYRNARLDIQAAELQLEETAQDVWQAIVQTYLLHLRNQRQLDVIRASIARDQTLFERAQARAESGVASALDLNRAEVQLANSEFQQVQAESAAYESELNLKRLLNLPLDTPVQLVLPEFPPLASAEFSPAELETVLAQRPVMRGADVAIEQAERTLRSAYGERIPDLSVGATYGRSGEWPGETSEVWSTEVSLSVPVWEGGRISAAILNARSQRRASELQREQTAQQIATDLRLALDQLRSTNRQVAIAERQVRLGRQELELAQTSFEEGVADNSELTDAQAGLATAEDQLVQATYAQQIARLNLARVQGRVQALAFPEANPLDSQPVNP